MKYFHIGITAVCGFDDRPRTRLRFRSFESLLISQQPFIVLFVMLPIFREDCQAVKGSFISLSNRRFCSSRLICRKNFMIKYHHPPGCVQNYDIPIPYPPTSSGTILHPLNQRSPVPGTVKNRPLTFPGDLQPESPQPGPFLS